MLFVMDDRRFTITKHGNHYVAIEDKYIDKDGRLNTTLTGWQLNAAETVDECIENTKRMVEMDSYKAQGMSDMEAFAKVFRLPLCVVRPLFEGGEQDEV